MVQAGAKLLDLSVKISKLDAKSGATPGCHDWPEQGAQS